MKVYIDRNNIQVELIRFRKKNRDFIVVGIFEVRQLFCFCLLNWAHCYARGVATVRWIAVHCARKRAFVYFIFQLTKNAGSYGIVPWIAIEGYNERLHRKKQHASSIHTIPSKNIAFIQVFFFESRNSKQYRSPNAIPRRTGSIILSFDLTRAIDWIQ